MDRACEMTAQSKRTLTRSKDGTLPRAVCSAIARKLSMQRVERIVAAHIPHRRRRKARK